MTDNDETNLPRAGLLRRVAALLYDMFLVAAIWMLLGYIGQFLLGGGSGEMVDGRVQTDSFQNNIYFTLMMGSSFGFYLWFWTRSGQTLGMIAWRIKTVALDGSLLRPQACLVRWLLAWPSFLLFGLGYLWLYLDPNGDALHDRYSGSKVVLLPKEFRPFK